MSRKLALSLFVLAAGTCFVTTPSEAAEITARDLRMETRTQWDYQPMQGPRAKARDRDFFSPRSTLKDGPETPPPPVVPGDYRDPPRAEDMVPPPENPKDPKTVTALEIGVQGSFYHYHEKDLGVKLQGPQGGVHALATGDIGGQWFLRADGRFTAGSPSYKGSGQMDTNPNYIGELRATIGRDFLTRNYGISPYVGVGYRYLYSDIRGMTTTGQLGYRRANHMLFVPIGLQPRVQLPNGDKLTLTAEYDPMLKGWQESFLSDVGESYPDLTNKQKTGYGVRADLMYQKDNWSAGPFMNYWNINQSTTECGVGSGASPLSVCGYEPHNHTLEYGFQLRYRFYQD
jgi:hypothetical protein